MEIQFEWTEPKRWDSINEINDEPVVYILCFKISNSYIPYYIGKSEKFKTRLFEHIFKLLGGAYRIYNKDFLDKFFLYKDKEFPPEVIHFPEAYNIVRFVNEHAVIKPHLDYMLNNLYYTYCHAEKSILKELERNIICHFGLKNLANTRCGEIHDYYNVKEELLKYFPVIGETNNL